MVFAADCGQGTGMCVFVVWEGEKESRDIDREGECRIGGGLWSASPQGRRRVSVRLDLTAPASPVPTHL